jgi:thioredoxin-like negative regulator of GroEL
MEGTPAQDLRAPVYFLRQLGQAYYVAGQVERYQKGDAQKAQEYYQKAEYHLERAMVVNPNHRATRLTLAAVYMETRKEEEAGALFALDRTMVPHVDLSQRRQQAPYKDLWIRDLYISALRRARP